MTIYTTKGLPERRSADHYPTPRWAVQEALTLVQESFIVEEGWPTRILDVGAGEGIWGEVARVAFGKNVIIVGSEVRDLPCPSCYDAWYPGDFLQRALEIKEIGPFDLIMGNPPFGEVERIIDACWGLLTPPIDPCGVDPTFGGGRLAFFLRLAFLEGQRRRDGLFKEHPLTSLGVYSKRVSFQADGKTNATAHALFLWQLGHPGCSALRFF